MDTKIETTSSQECISSSQIEGNKKSNVASEKITNALALLAQYSGSESDDEDEVDNSIYRKPAVESSSSSSSDSDEELDIKVIEKKIREPVVSDGDSDEENASKKKKKEPLKVKGELAISDLPPIEDLQITVDERECIEIGCVTTIVDQLVLVEALRNSIPLDIDSVLFLDNGKKTLGKIFDVIGPVTVPIYCIRFNSHDEVLAKGISVGNKVFCAPRTEHSSFVILSQIMNKGSDASWKDDVEPPENLVEYSDDEEERRTKRQAKANRAQHSGEPREFIRGHRQMHYQQPPNPAYQSPNLGYPPPNLAYPNYSWHQNLPPTNLMNLNQYQNFPH